MSHTWWLRNCLSAYSGLPLWQLLPFAPEIPQTSFEFYLIIHLMLTCKLISISGFGHVISVSALIASSIFLEPCYHFRWLGFCPFSWNKMSSRPPIHEGVLLHQHVFPHQIYWLITFNTTPNSLETLLFWVGQYCLFHHTCCCQWILTA